MSAAAARPGGSTESALGVRVFLEAAKEIIEGAFEPLWLRGEVTEFKPHRNGHWYFTLKDGEASLRCKVWKSATGRIPAPPKVGDQITAYGRVNLWEVTGEFSFVVTAMEMAGDGLWRRRLEMARAALERDGLLAPERKRKLPVLPRVVAVITSPDGAALHDIVTVLRRRAPFVRVVVAGAKVQGEGAVEELVAAIGRVSRWGGADVVIVGRGGGSREDLQPFNEEAVARALAACAVPTISAVGHETDVTLCDLVADLRAPTPSAAAEHAVPDVKELRAHLALRAARLRTALTRRAERMREGVRRAARALRTTIAHALHRRAALLSTAAAHLNALSPLATLERGYAVARDSITHHP
ncbi:MAG TPA: exodeoxyribonuclease VII large subunit, partial [Gemmatimonadaceae bacterium]|nr:exodeoxyribonuclease VII large subunit [Gemmatimonadaceae bacterium]